MISWIILSNQADQIHQKLLIERDYRDEARHPAYLNAGEIPVGGRGSLGRTSPYFRLDMHADYPWHISESKKLDFVADFFNVFNSTKVRLPNQDFQLNGGVPNVDFLQPQLFYLPFNMRLGMRFEW